MNTLKITREQFFEMEELRKLSDLEKPVLYGCSKCNSFRFINERFCNCGGRNRKIDKVEIIDF